MASNSQFPCLCLLSPGVVGKNTSSFSHLSLHCWGAVWTVQWTFLYFQPQGQFHRSMGGSPALWFLPCISCEGGKMWAAASLHSPSGPASSLAVLNGMNSIPRTSTIWAGLQLLTFITNLVLIWFLICQVLQMYFLLELEWRSLIPMKITLGHQDPEHLWLWRSSFLSLSHSLLAQIYLRNCGKNRSW